jgi:hypothetical protein
MGSGGFLVLYMAAGIFGFIQALSALRDHTEKAVGTCWAATLL